MFAKRAPFYLGLLFGVGAAVVLGGFSAAHYNKRTGQVLNRRLALLTEENARLRLLVDAAENAKAAAANKAQREAIEEAVVEIRGLPFKSPVDYQLLDRKEIKATIAGKLAEVFSEEEFINMTAALARLGLLPAGYPLREKYVDLLGEQVAAFYDQHAHKLFMFEDASLENAQNRIVLAHELMHALQDQHFGLARLPLEIKTNDDRAAAASALVEGEATLVMSEYMLKNLSLASLKDNLAATFAQDMAQLAKAPPYLREMLIFPYLRGQEFCGALYARGGYEAIAKAYAAPPNSTAQILHPEKYLAEPREGPMAIEWAENRANGEAPIADNVVGEMGVRILHNEWLGAPAGEHVAEGWRGDRYLCFAKGEALVWKTVWVSEDVASAFAKAQGTVLQKRYGAEHRRVIRWAFPRPNEAVLIDAHDEKWADLLAAQFAK